MKIDVVLGTATIADVCFGAALSRVDFLKTSLGANAKVGVVNEGWITFHVEPEPGFHGSVKFKDDRLIQIVVSMPLPDGAVKAWDRELEMRRKALHDAWLSEQFGDPPYEYAWGTIASEFTEQDISSDIAITFGKFPVTESWRERKAREREELAHKKP